MLLARGYGGFDIELYMLTFTFGDVVVLVGCCVVCFPYLRSLVDCFFFMALRSSSASSMLVLMIAASLSSALIMFFYMFVHFFLAPYDCLSFEVSICVSGLVSLTWIDREIF